MIGYFASVEIFAEKIVSKMTCNVSSRMINLHNSNPLYAERETYIMTINKQIAHISVYMLIPH